MSRDPIGDMLDAMAWPEVSIIGDAIEREAIRRSNLTPRIVVVGNPDCPRNMLVAMEGYGTLKPRVVGVITNISAPVRPPSEKEGT